MRKLAIKTRGNRTETEHYGYLALCDSKGKLDKTLNDDEFFYVRSCIKPIQAKVCLDILKEELTDDFLTISIASHLSTNDQISILQRMLIYFNINEENLHCGTKSSTNKEVFKSKIYHNCAGKHILHIAAQKGSGLNENYYESSHEIQKAIYQELLNLSGVESIESAIDGCGLPTYFMSLKDLAFSFSKTSLDDSYKKIYKTVNANAHLISAEGRFDQELMLQFPGKFFAKTGADGMMLVTNLETNQSLVVKILDGDKRVKDIVAKKTLEKLSWIKKDSFELDSKVYNSLGHVAGEFRGLAPL